MNVLVAPWAMKLSWEELRIHFAVYCDGKNQGLKRRIPINRYCPQKYPIHKHIFPNVPFDTLHPVNACRLETETRIVSGWLRAMV